MISSETPLNHIILDNFISNFNSGKFTANLYAALSFIKFDKEPFKNTFFEYENMIWDNMIALIKIMPGELYFGCEKYIYEDYIDDFGKTKFYCLNDTEETIKLYRLINRPSTNSSEKPNHIDGIKLYNDGFEWEFLQSFDINNYDKRSTVEHVAVNLEIGKKIKSQMLFISTDFKNPIPTKSTIVSLVVNPLNLNMKPLTSDFEWYAHRINFGNVKEGSFYLNDDTNYNGNVVFYDIKKTGYIVSNKDFNKVKFSQLTFTDNDTYPIKKLIPSQVKRNSGYTIFMQKFKPMFVYKQLKFVISIKEE